MHWTPNPQPRIAGTPPQGRDERGMALVFALLGILLLSMLAAALMFVTNLDAYASFNYKTQMQASYAALAGVHRTVDWFRTVYTPWLNPTTGTPAYATAPPTSASTYVWNPPALPTYTGSGGPAVLGDGANFPTSGPSNMVNEFDTMRGSLTSLSLGDATADFTIRDATLLSHDRYKAFDGATDRIIERWRLRVRGRVRDTAGRTLAAVEETAVFQTAPLPIFGNAIQGQCEVQMNGALTTDSFDSANGVYGGSNLFTGEDAGASVASNSFTGSSGGSGVINGDLYYGASPDAAGGCTTSGESVNDSIVQGDVSEYPSMPYPPITPTFSTGSSGKNDCTKGAVAYDAATEPFFRYTPNGPSSNNYPDCSLTGGNVLEFRVPNVDETSGPAPAQTFFIRGLTINPGSSYSSRVHAITRTLCSNADPIIARCPATLLYISDTLNLGGGGLLSASTGNCDPTKFTIYYTGTADASIGGTSGFCGTVYAPNATVNIAGNTQIWGAVTGKSVVTGGGVMVHYDLSLQRMRIMVSPFRTINQSRDIF